MGFDQLSWLFMYNGESLHARVIYVQWRKLACTRVRTSFLLGFCAWRMHGACGPGRRPRNAYT